MQCDRLRRPPRSPVLLPTLHLSGWTWRTHARSMWTTPSSSAERERWFVWGDHSHCAHAARPVGAEVPGNGWSTCQSLPTRPSPVHAAPTVARASSAPPVTRRRLGMQRTRAYRPPKPAEIGATRTFGIVLMNPHIAEEGPQAIRRERMPPDKQTKTDALRRTNKRIRTPPPPHTRTAVDGSRADGGQNTQCTTASGSVLITLPGPQGVRGLHTAAFEEKAPQLSAWRNTAYDG